MEPAANKLTAGIFGAVAVINLLLVLCYAPFAEYAWKRNTDLPYIVLLAGAVLILAFLYYAVKRLQNPLAKVFGRGYTFSGVLFLAEIYWTCNAYFKTGWDVGNCMLPSAIELSYGWPISDTAYFSMCPNNIMLLWIQSKVFKLAWRFAIFDGETGMMSLVALNCLISAIAALLIYRIVNKLAGQHTALFAWIVYALYMGLCPWLLISYSDSIALLFPILVIWLYLQKDRKPWIKWFLIGFFGFGAYYIKPQCCIVLIAVVMLELLEQLYTKDKKWRELLAAGAMILLAMIAAYGFQRWVVKDTGLTPEKGRDFGIAHFLLMGLNEETNGGYWQPDAIFSYDFTDPAQRRAADLKAAGERVRNYGFAGMLEHLAKKQLVNFGDGEFAWGDEGGFWLEYYDLKNNYISGRIRSLYYEDGKNVHYMETYMQFFWVWILCFMGTAVIKKDRSKAENICMLSILGLILFQLLFEARARYVYCYVPLMLVLAVTGFKICLEKIENRIKILRK